MSSSGSKTRVFSAKVASLLRFTVSIETGRGRLATWQGARRWSSRSESGSRWEFSSALRSESIVPARWEPTKEGTRSGPPASDSDTSSSSDSYRLRFCLLKRCRVREEVGSNMLIVVELTLQGQALEYSTLEVIQVCFKC